MEIKNVYIRAAMEVVAFDGADIIATSGEDPESSGSGIELPDHEW